MPIQYKIDVIGALRDAGYTSYKIRKEGLINQTALQRMREGKLIAWEQLAIICRLLNCQPGDLVEYVPDTPTSTNAPHVHGLATVPPNSAYAASLRDPNKFHTK